MTNDDRPTRLAVDGWRESPHRGIYVALLLVSMGLLTLEISLTRFFSFTIWYHFAYLTISVALLGFASSGAIVASFPGLFRRHGHAVLVSLIATGSVLTVTALFLLARFPIEILDATARPFRFSLSLLGYYVVVGLPFLLAGFAVSVPFAAYPRLMGRLYFWDLLGAALGCFTAVVLIKPIGIPALIIIAAGLLMAGAASLSIGIDRRAILPLTAAAFAFILLAVPLGDRLEISVTSSKHSPPSKADLASGAGYSSWTVLNRVDADGWVRPMTYQHWAMTGLKTGYTGPLPPVARLDYDGSNGSNIYSFSGSFDEYAMLDHHILKTPYVIRDTPRVLVIGVGGGIDMINAVKQGAGSVTGIELHPETIMLLKDRLRDFTGGFYDRENVRLVADEGRHYVRKSNEEFDLVQITMADTFSAQTTGAYVLAESYLYTVEAVQDYFNRLSSDGVLSMVVQSLLFGDLPPPLATRLALNARRALETMGVRNPSDNIVVIGATDAERTYGTQVVVVKKTPFTPGDLSALETFASSNGFDLVYAPGQAGDKKSTIATILGSDEEKRQETLETAWFRMDAVHDSDPFFYQVGKWSHMTPKSGVWFFYPGSFLGHLVLAMMIVQSVLLGAVLIIGPLLFGAGGHLKTPGVVRYLAYFLALGVGFMFVEISFVQTFVLFLGSPTYSLSITIFSLLLFSSIGSLLSTRYVDRPEWALRRLLTVMVPLVVGYAFGLSHLLDAFLHLALLPRVLIVTFAQLPIGLGLGMFMPLGIACVTRRHARLVPWAWGVNGIGSVVGTTLAVVLAMAWGFPVVTLLAAGLYLIGTTWLLRSSA